MTPEQIFDRLMGRHEYLRLVPDGQVLLEGGPNALVGAAGRAADCDVRVSVYSSFVSCSVYVGRLVRHPSWGFQLGEHGKMHATSEWVTEEIVEWSRQNRAGTAIPGWDLPGLRWRMRASAPMSSTAVPFLGRTDQWLVCESPITHMIAERRTLVAYQAHPSDISRMPV